MRCRSRGMKRLFWRVYSHGLLLLVFAFVASAGVWAIFGHTDHWRRNLSTVAALVGARCGQGTTADDGRPAIAAVSARIGLSIGCFDRQGREIERGGSPLPAPTVEQRARLDRDGESSLYLKHPPRVAQAVRGAGAVRGYVVIGTIPHRPPVRRLLLWLAALLSVLALGSIPLVRAIVAPVTRMTATARAVGDGDLSARTGVSRRDELGEMARAFDEMVQRLEQMIQGERELLANVSHELRTPLARIRVALELAEEGDTSSAQRHLKSIGTDLVELEALIEDLLTTARLDIPASLDKGGAPTLYRDAVQVADLVQQAAARFRERCPQCVLEVSVEGDVGQIEADGQLLQRVLDNLLSNARTHGSADSPIGLRALIQQGSARIEVTDQGTGIAPEDLPRVFEPFFRTERSRSRQTGGVGLGLTLCKRIVEAHGGTIEARSSGRGATFGIMLSLSDPDGAA